MFNYSNSVVPINYVIPYLIYQPLPRLNIYLVPFYNE